MIVKRRKIVRVNTVVGGEDPLCASGETPALGEIPFIGEIPNNDSFDDISHGNENVAADHAVVENDIDFKLDVGNQYKEPVLKLKNMKVENILLKERCTKLICHY